MDLTPHTRYFIKVTVKSDAGEVGESKQCFFQTAKMSEKWSADWIGPYREDDFHPELLREFCLEKDVRKAILYICGLGLFEAYINGKKTGEDYLAPFVNDYQSCLQYMTYEVTELLEKENRIKVLLGNGWYKGRIGFADDRAVFGDRFALIAELRVEYTDGTIEIIKTDKTWSYRASNILESDIFDGEVIDELRWAGKENTEREADIISLDKERLCERYSLTVKEQEEVTVKRVIKTPSGETVLDMGQNFAGYIVFKGVQPAGTKVKLEFGEILQNGNFYRDNYRSAKSRFIYTFGNSYKEVRPHFTFFGFRYVKVSGWIGGVKAEEFVGKAVYSTLDRTGTIETGHKELNQLYSNCIWGQKSNFLDMPTDCPQRNERLGWTGDAQVFAPTASYNMNTKAFYNKFLRDLRYDQIRHNGAVAPFLPNLQPHMSCSVWGDAATFIPDVLYEYYGDVSVLTKNYQLMKDWVDYIKREGEKKNSGYLYNYGFHYGDWLALDGVTDQSCMGGTKTYYIASIYYYASACKVAKAAEVIGKSDDAKYYQDLSTRIRKAILAEYFSPNGRLTIDTQTAYYVALKFGVYICKDKLIECLCKRLKKDCYKIKGGFVGATMMCTVLAENGMADIAYEFLLNEDYPGWLHCVNLGATTIWERWNSVLDDGSISGTGMNSLNHYAYGSVMEFVYKYCGGLRPLEPGFRKVVIEPIPNVKLGYLKMGYESAAGYYQICWKLSKDGRFKVQLEIPFGTEAKVRLPGYEKEEMWLSPGLYSYDYVIAPKYLNKVCGSTRLKQLSENQEAMNIIEREMPDLYKLITNADIEQGAMSLNDLAEDVFLPYQKEEIARLIYCLGGTVHEYSL